MILNAIKRNNFNGQNIYEGLDTHHKRRMESIYSDEFELKIFNQQPGVDQLERYLKRNYPGAIIIWHMKQGLTGARFNVHLLKSGSTAMLSIPQIRQAAIKKTNVKR